MSISNVPLNHEGHRKSHGLLPRCRLTRRVALQLALNAALVKSSSKFSRSSSPQCSTVSAYWEDWRSHGPSSSRSHRYRSLHLLYSLLPFEQGTFETGEIGFQGTFLGKGFVISRVIVEVGVVIVEGFRDSRLSNLVVEYVLEPRLLCSLRILFFTSMECPSKFYVRQW